MNALELVNTGLTAIASVGIMGIWFKLGALSKGHDGLNERVTRLEDHVISGGKT